VEADSSACQSHSCDHSGEYLTTLGWRTCFAVMVFTTRGELREVLFLALSVTLFVYEISLELLTGFMPYSQGRRVWSLPDEFECQGQRSRSSGTKTAFCCHFGGLHAVYVW